MIKPIIKEIDCLVKCIDATEADRILISDMQETYKECRNLHNYLSANMIGVNKRIFIITYNMIDFLFINPVIINTEDEYLFPQPCIYHKALRTAKRYKKIEVEYYDFNFNKNKITIYDEFAEAFLHMMDHINGIQL